MTVTRDDATSVLMGISNAMVRLHKEQFGRGPSSARTHYAGPDTMISILENALLPAERQMVELGSGERVQETRLHFQNASSERFIEAIEAISGRKVTSFASACDPEQDMVYEIFRFAPREPEPELELALEPA